MEDVCILRIVNNRISLPEIYYYARCVGVVKLQSRGALIQTLAFLNHSYDVNDWKSLTASESFIMLTHFRDPPLRIQSSTAAKFTMLV